MARCARARVAQVKERLVRVWAESAAARAPAQARTFTRNVKDATARASTSAHAQTGPVSETMAAGGAEELLFCHAWLRFIRATLFHRKTRAFKCFCQPTAAQCYKREDSQFIDRIDEERGFFFISHRDVEN